MSWVELWDRAARRQKCDAKQGDVADAFSAVTAGTHIIGEHEAEFSHQFVDVSA